MIACSPRLRAAALSLFIMTAFAACNRISSSAAASESAPKPAAAPMPAGATLPHADGQRALQYTREVVAFGPRYVSSPGHAQTEAYLRKELQGDNLQEDTFIASTPAGSLRMTNFIAKFPGKKDGLIVVTGHYDTLYRRKDFVGANDGGSSTGLLLELARQLRGKQLDGYSVWLVWFDGEEAIRAWSPTDSIYGSRHLAAKWAKDGTLKKIQAFLLLDMIGDADLNIERDSNSTPWLEDVVFKAATDLGYQAHFFGRPNQIEDDHLPFARAGVPVADLIDYDYGPNNSYWHTAQDTLDKLSPQSLEIVGSVVLETIRLLNQS
jgi:Zn-dependent M28 family amino/carboxypeptidase